MKVSYEQTVRVELSQNPTVGDIENAIAALRAEASVRLGPSWRESVAVIGGYTGGGMVGGQSSFPSLIFQATPASHSKEGEQG